MLQKVSDQVTSAALSMVTAMSKEDALKLLSGTPAEEIQKALAEQKKQLKTGKKIGRASCRERV